MDAQQWLDGGPIEGWEDGTARTLLAGGRLIAVVRSEGEFYAVEDICTHDGAELTGGLIEGSRIVCPRHGAVFCLRTGQVLAPPAYEPIQAFETRIETGHVWVRCASR